MATKNSSGSPDDRNSSSAKSTPAPAKNSSGSPDDRSSSPAPKLQTVAPRNSSGSPDDRSRSAPARSLSDSNSARNPSGSPDDRNRSPTTRMVQSVPVSQSSRGSTYPVDANGRISRGNPMALDTYGQGVPADPLSAFMSDAQKHRDTAIAARTAAGVKPSDGPIDWNALMHDLNAPTRDRGVKFDGGIDWGGITSALSGPFKGAVDAMNAPAPTLVPPAARKEYGPPGMNASGSPDDRGMQPRVDPESGMVQDSVTGTYYPAYQLQALNDARKAAAIGDLGGGLTQSAGMTGNAALPPIAPPAAAGGLAAAMPVNNDIPLNAENAPERDLAATGEPVYPGLEGMVPGAQPAVVNQPQAKPSVWDNVVDGAGKVLSHTAIGTAMSNMFPDTWYGMGEAMKGHGNGTVDNTNPGDLAYVGMGGDSGGGGLEGFIDANNNGIDDRLEGYVAPVAQATSRVLARPNVSFPALPPYRPGFDPEYRYFSGPGYAEGGLVDAAQPQAAPTNPMSGMDPRVTIIADAEDALEGHSDNPQQAIQAFVKAFGQEALQQLAAQVKQGMSLRRGGTPRMVTGPGGPKDDAVPAMIDGVQPAALSSGEMVMPVEAVAGAGNGDPRVGADRLMALSHQLSQHA